MPEYKKRRPMRESSPMAILTFVRMTILKDSEVYRQNALMNAVASLASVNRVMLKSIAALRMR